VSIPDRLFFHPRTLVLLLMVSLGGMLLWQWWSDPQRYVAMGMQGIRSGNGSDVERAAAGLKEVSTHRPHYQFLLAAMELQSGQTQSALRRLTTAMEHPDLAVDARVLAGQAAYELGAAGNAKVFWEEALRLYPESASAHRWLGVMYYDLGAMDNALAHLSVVSKLLPEDPRPDRLMGLINHDYQRPADAIRHYQQSLRRDPRQQDANDISLELAECQIMQREYAAALESLDRCAASPRKDRLQATCQMNLGELETAKSLAQRALESDPRDVEAIQLNSQLALIDGDLEKGVDLLRQAVTVDPYKHAVRTQLAQLLERMGRSEEAAKEVQEADQLQQRWQRFSDLQMDAINQPTNGEVRYEIGQLASQLGKPQLALTWYRAALAIDPTMAKAGEAALRLQRPQGE